MENVIDEDLERTYNELENNALTIDNWSIAGIFKKLRYEKEIEGKERIAEIAQWEIDFFCFNIFPQELRKFEKKIDWKRFDEEQLEYLIDRQKNVKNSRLKSHYSHILWLSPKKEVKYAESAVNSYLLLVNHYTKKSDENLKFSDLKITIYIINAYRISHQIQYRKGEVKIRLVELLRNYKSKDKSAVVLKQNLIELMIEEKRNFTKEQLDDTNKTCKTYVEVLLKEKEFLDAINILKLGKRISIIQRNNVYYWDEKIGFSYESWMKQHEKTNINLALECCESSTRSYELGGNEEKVKELKKKYSELKKNQKFAEIKIPYNKEKIEKYTKKCQDFADRFDKEKSSEEICYYLIHDKSFIPKLKEVKMRVSRASNKMIFSQFLPIHLVDRQGHKTKEFKAREDIMIFYIFQEYKRDLELKILDFNEIILAAIKNKKLDFLSLTNYLRKNSWLGVNFEKFYPNNVNISFNWLSLLSPAFMEYFDQMSKYLHNASYTPIFILSIDSLVLKIEGVIRDICIFLNIPTSFIQKNTKKTQEKNIDQLLREEDIKRIILEDELFFYKFVLVEKGGFNLRHDVSHSLLLPQNYSLYYMQLLFLIILKLGQYYDNIEEL